MMRAWWAYFALLPCLLLAQPSAFTVASIKPNRGSDDRFMLRPLPGGGLTATGVTLKMLIMFGYKVASYQISSAPTWIGMERWDIEAKTDEVEGRLPAAQFDVLLRSLIEDRFQLKSHRATRKLPVYALVTKKSLKLMPHPVDQGTRPSVNFGRGSATFTNSSIAGLVGQLTLYLDGPVLDRTGLKGVYDFKLHWTPAPNEGGSEAMGLPPRAELPQPDDSSVPSIFTALQEQLGLKLKSTKGPVDMLVIDHVEKPSEN
jgi:uncharacterized protein (TIGR03435 family)